MTKPIDLQEYKKWLQSSLGIVVTNKTEAHYNAVASKVKNDFAHSPFWQALSYQLPDYDNQFLISTGYNLLLANYQPELLVKSFQSVLIKSFRKNVLSNHNWPNPPNGGWITPDNWVEKLNDIVRTCFVVKYLDGVEFLLQRIQILGSDQRLSINPFYEARDEGYYALHIYTKLDFDIPKITWDTETKSMSIELQITTQLQDVITKLTHKYYEERRVATKTPDHKWQWDYKSEEFVPNYLGHILHYVEGMIMEIREKQRKVDHEKSIF